MYLDEKEMSSAVLAESWYSSLNSINDAKVFVDI